MSTYKDLLAEAGPNGTRRAPRPRFTGDERAARYKELRLRASLAQGRAQTVLRRRHLDEYTELFRILRDEINAERGPLPGDE